MRKCTKCGIEKELDKFECIAPTKGWHRRECKECTKARVKNYADQSKTAIQQYKMQYHAKNKDKIVAKVNEWVKNNPERRRKNALAYYYRLQHDAIMQYGGYKCVWCGIDEPLALCLDHVENDGNKHRKELGFLGGHRLYKWLRDQNYPPGFQVLCMNCNHAKHRNGGKLPQSLYGRCNDQPETV